MKIGLLGLGNVAEGILSILKDNHTLLHSRTGESFEVKSALVRNLEKARKIAPSSLKLTTQASDILENTEIDIVIEVMGGEEPALTYIKTALKNKKHVITANKAIIAQHRPELLKLAQENNVQLLFEASVAGGIPIIRTLTIGYAANHIHSLYGILNGTTNYILTNMEREEKEYPQILKNAQKLGFAEADPTMDISGLDAAYKLIILAGVAFHTTINLENIYYEGIDNITLKDITYAKDLGYKIKLLAIGKTNPMIFKVHPTLIPISHPLAGIDNEFNAIFIDGNAVGESMLVGKGAGALPTGSAIVSDLIEIALTPKKQIPFIEDKATKLSPIEKTYSQFYIRLTVADKVGTLEKITSLLSKQTISLSKLFQKEKSKNTAEIVMITHVVQESHMKTTIANLIILPEIIEAPVVIRVGLEEPTTTD
ncbi:MAG: homoserine dehydrogenase [Candidatus Margulisbacteria bacterium]|nr:homoserine dehydrogenase [Candidatus Margulisiibacteriota bacterium]